jgi:hypothetical protein
MKEKISKGRTPHQYQKEKNRIPEKCPKCQNRKCSMPGLTEEPSTMHPASSKKEEQKSGAGKGLIEYTW